MIVPLEVTLVTSRPSFFDSSSVGLMYSAFLPLNQPNMSVRTELEAGGKQIHVAGVSAPAEWGIWVVPYPQITSLPKKSLDVNVNTI